jgi:hypothetical protein
MRIARCPAIVMGGNAIKNARARFRPAELVVTPRGGKRARQPRVIGVSDQPPTGFAFHP